MADPTLSELEARFAETQDSTADPVERIDALNNLAWALRSSDLGRANGLATQARAEALTHSYPLGQARAARTMGMTGSGREGMRKVLDLAEEAKRLFDQVEDHVGRAASRDFLASIYEHIGDLAGALPLALEALSIARDIDDPIRQGYALSNVGGILAASGEPDAAVEHLFEALALFERVDNSAGVNTICSRLSQALRDAGRLDEALTYAQKVWNSAARGDGGFERWSGKTVMAEVANLRGNPTEAERLYKEALEELGSDPGREIVGVESQIAIARLMVARGAFEEAEAELCEVLQSVEGHQVSIVAEADCHDVWADLCERRGHFERAVKHLRSARKLRTQIFERDGNNKLAQVEVRAAMEAAKRDAEVHKSRFVELHGVQAKLLESEKMALLGKLAAGTAHELNSPLGVLRSNTQLFASASKRLISLVAEHPEQQHTATKLEGVIETCRRTSEEAVERIGAVALSFRRFTQLDQAEQCSFDVREGLNSALSLLQPTISDTIEVVRDFKPVPAIEGWPRELNHAFMTVLQNAVQAISDSGQVLAETETCDDQVLVRIRDTGRGMTQDQAKHLFDVAWSEDGNRTRMRLGLSAAYATTQKHGGTMEVHSTLGEGTTMVFRFPIAGPPSQNSGANRPAFRV